MLNKIITLKLIARMLKLFAALSSMLLHNYFDDPIKLFLYLAKFLDISAIFSYVIIYIY